GLPGLPGTCSLQGGMGLPELPDREGCPVPVFALLPWSGTADPPGASAALCPRRGPRRHGSAHAPAIVLHRHGSRLADQHLSGPASQVGRRSLANSPLPALLVTGRAGRPVQQPTLASGSSVRLISSSAFSSQARAGVKGRRIISKARSSFDRRVSRARERGGVS